MSVVEEEDVSVGREEDVEEEVEEELSVGGVGDVVLTVEENVLVGGEEELNVVLVNVV